MRMIDATIGLVRVNSRNRQGRILLDNSDDLIGQPRNLLASAFDTKDSPLRPFVTIRVVVGRLQSTVNSAVDLTSYVDTHIQTRARAQRRR